MDAKLVRLSMSIEEPLFEKLERLVEGGGYGNRSEFIRDMIRDRLVEEEWGRHEEVLGTITLVYDHRKRELSEKLTEMQHHKHHNVLATTHLHISESICAEMIMVKGHAEDIRALADGMRSQKGVLHATLSMSSTGESLN